MRVISGIYKNYPLESPNDSNTHPMGSREKLALFNIIASYLKDADVLDAFAGSGALGIEALSRGARKVTFIEKSKKAAKTIAKNLQNIGNEASIKTQIINNLIEKTTFTDKFDIIIADPPYENIEIGTISLLIPHLKKDGIFVLSHPKIPAPLPLPNLQLISTHHYAAAHISIYQHCNLHK